MKTTDDKTSPIITIEHIIAETYVLTINDGGQIKTLSINPDTNNFEEILDAYQYGDEPMLLELIQPLLSQATVRTEPRHQAQASKPSIAPPPPTLSPRPETPEKPNKLPDIGILEVNQENGRIVLLINDETVSYTLNLSEHSVKDLLNLLMIAINTGDQQGILFYLQILINRPDTIQLFLQDNDKDMVHASFQAQPALARQDAPPPPSNKNKQEVDVKLENIVCLNESPTAHVTLSFNGASKTYSIGPLSEAVKKEALINIYQTHGLTPPAKLLEDAQTTSTAALIQKLELVSVRFFHNGYVAQIKIRKNGELIQKELGPLNTVENQTLLRQIYRRFNVEHRIRIADNHATIFLDVSPAQAEAAAEVQAAIEADKQDECTA